MAQLVLALSVVLALSQAPGARLVQVAPLAQPSGPFIRSSGCDRAVVLIHGFTAQPSQRNKAEFHSYQYPNSPLVKSLARVADVFSFAYAQTAPVDQIASSTVLHEGLASLRQLGYREIVLVGFSAGGLVARQLVEDTPGSGVTRVIQVCTPNNGTGWSVASPSVFAHSLSHKSRQRWLQGRWGVTIPDTVQFVCVIGTGLVEGDGVVSIGSQWPEDLQLQGIPAHLLHTDHLHAARCRAGVELLTELVQDGQPRWDAFDVAIMKKRLEIWK